MTPCEVNVMLALGSDTLRVGTLWFHANRGIDRASFEYDKAWLSHPEKFALEPALQLTEGAFHTKQGNSLFGALGDSAPDRWGRILMRRAHRVKASHITPRTLLEIDYLLGVNDEARQGALRFSVPPKNKVFLASNTLNAIPSLIHLPKLLAAAEHFIEDSESAKDLKLLLAPGSSLGGARPKASVRNQQGNLAIAKFPKKDDEFNVVLWEAVALSLAKKAKIRVPAWQIKIVMNKPVLIIQRFDRIKDQRIPFLSSMSMLGARDNEQRSYLEIAYALAQYGALPKEDMSELWRRIVFTIMISNTDDHLRNHGFLYERHKGWRLSPAYDLNPTPIELKPRMLSTAIDFENTNACLATALDVAKEFRLSKSRAHEIVKEVRVAVTEWRAVAAKMGISNHESNRMSSAFVTNEHNS